jgi:drug/metabolite transporter (DMT)-like permease
MGGGEAFRNPGVQAALAAAALFGLATPLAKLLIGAVDTFLLAGLLYLGSGLGLTVLRALRGDARPVLPPAERPWLAGAILAGGVVGPVLLMFGLAGMTASGASLLLNAEGVFTALIAWFVFRENFDRRIALGMLAIVAGAAVLSVEGGVTLAAAGPSLLVLGACLAWGIDNNLTRRVSLADASWIAAVKGLAAGVVNTTLALAFGAGLPGALPLAGALVLGFVAFGLSLTLFVRALRDLGTARTGAYFSTAPFFGALLALALGEPVTLALAVAAALMAVGVWLHLAERHVHEHRHEPMEHEHWHRHDDHHGHVHPDPVPVGIGHSHRHRHEPLVHAHPHYPDAHHRHRH